MVEGAPLLREYGPKAHRGFESLRLRHYLRGVKLHIYPDDFYRALSADSGRSARLTAPHVVRIATDSGLIYLGVVKRCSL